MIKWLLEEIYQLLLELKTRGCNKLIFQAKVQSYLEMIKLLYETGYIDSLTCDYMLGRFQQLLTGGDEAETTPVEVSDKTSCRAGATLPDRT